MIKNLVYIFNFFSKKKIIFLFVLITLFTFLESIGIGLVFPLLISILDDTLYNNLIFFKSFQNYLNFANPIVFILILTLLVFLLKFFISLIFSFFQSKEIYNFEFMISNLSLKKILSEKYNYIKKINSSEIINNTITQCSIISEYVIKNIFGLVADIILINGIIIILFIANPKLSLICLIYSLIVILGTNLIIRRRLKQLGSFKQKIDKNKLQSLQETLSLLKNIKLLSQEEKFIRNFENENFSYKEVLSKEFFISTIPRFFIEFSSVLLFVTLMIYYNLQSSNQLVSILPSIALLGAAGARLIPALSRLQFYFVQIRFGLPVIDSIKNIINKKNEYAENEKILDESIFNNFEEIELKNISFRHKDTENLIIENSSFSINKNDIVGITGKSGSGKTTLVDIIAGLHKIETGKILINGRPIENYNSKTWMKKIGYVQQNIFLIDSTIEKNLLLFADDKNVNLNKISFLNFVNSLQNKFNTEIGENGKFLSGGQIQRLGIARVLLNKPKILILDESTNALDTKTETEILEELSKYREDLLILIISHNKDTLKVCNKIISIEDKKIKLL